MTSSSPFDWLGRKLRGWAGNADRFYWGSGISDDVPALTYYLLISLAPFLLGLASIIALVTEGDTLLGDLTESLTRDLPPDLAEAILGLARDTYANSPLLLTLAIVGCLWTCGGGVGVLERCLSRLLGRDRWHPIITRLRHIGLAALLVAAVLAVITAGAFGAGLAAKFHLPLGGWAVPLLSLAVTLAVSYLLLRLAPRGGLTSRAAWAGAIPTALGLQVVPSLVGLYVNAASGLQAHRIFFLLVVLVLGCSLSAQTILIGAGLAARAERRLRGYQEM
jgi:uncharacterized BrkB/YihY/UPF0761 family membrane protein